uniref:Uncharacterized protein n=1 Tax=Pararge aegeria TaxID=116150 RepID=S4PNJ5_9NEOP
MCFFLCKKQPTDSSSIRIDIVATTNETRVLRRPGVTKDIVLVVSRQTGLKAKIILRPLVFDFTTSARDL